ncbi:SAM-dependent methyltransferase [Variovorax sp. UC122_21]|uniref:SAM-dependent methyltransferase n=1 Tax=Variovorax sp. UC122_21 TaxID=3374554 RepID=UPI0037582732
MPQDIAFAIRWVEKGLVPDTVVRRGIRRLLKDRLSELYAGNTPAVAELTQDFVGRMRSASLAPLPEKANAQHYEVPAAFFGQVLGNHRKYSSCYWPEGTHTLEEAESAALASTCERAGLENGQDILELGCGWGSLTLWMAAHYPGSRITALSNSASQREYIEAEAARRGLANVRVLTRDINVFDTEERFDRVVSVEMFEHLRNWPQAFANVARWLRPGGRFFMHVFVHREAPYPFEVRDASDWISAALLLGRHDAQRRPRAALPGRPAAAAPLALGRPPLPAHRRSLAAQHGPAARGAAPAVQGHLRRRCPCLVDALAPVLHVGGRAVRLRARAALVGQPLPVRAARLKPAR